MFEKTLLAFVALLAAHYAQAESWAWKKFKSPNVPLQIDWKPKEGYVLPEPIVFKLVYLANADDSVVNAQYNCPQGVRSDFGSTVARASTFLTYDFAQRLGQLGGRINPHTIFGLLGDGEEPPAEWGWFFRALRRDLRLILVPVTIDSAGTHYPAWLDEKEMPAHFTVVMSAWVDPCAKDDGAFGKRARIAPVMQIYANPALAVTGPTAIGRMVPNNDHQPVIMATESSVFARSLLPAPSLTEGASRPKVLQQLRASLRQKPGSPKRQYADQVFGSADNSIRVSFNRGVLGRGLILLPDLTHETIAEERNPGNKFFANHFNIQEVQAQLSDLVLRYGARLEQAVAERFVQAPRADWNSPDREAARDFAKQAYEAELEFLTLNVTFPTLGRAFVGLELGPEGKALFTIIQAEQRQQSANRAALFSGLLIGAGAGYASGQGDTLLANQLLQTGMSTTSALGEKAQAAGEVASSLSQMQSTYALQVAGQEIKITAGTWWELHETVKKMYFDVPGAK